eukprot:757586-Hanusia_phi.AAC.4
MHRGERRGLQRGGRMAMGPGWDGRAAFQCAELLGVKVCLPVGGHTTCYGSDCHGHGPGRRRRRVGASRQRRAPAAGAAGPPAPDLSR